MESLEPRQLLAGDTYLVNFQFDEATPVTRYLRDSGAVFGDRGGGFSYGWSSDHSDVSRERSATPDQRLDTLIHFHAGATWDFALANGLYEVTIAVGDPANNDGVHTINAEGVNFWNAVPDGNAAMVKTLQVTINDGRLTLDAGVAPDSPTPTPIRASISCQELCTNPQASVISDRKNRDAATMLRRLRRSASIEIGMLTVT